MHPGTRRLVRSCIWVALGCCLILDGALGEAAISGVGDVGYFDESGYFKFPGPEPRLWLPIAGFIVLQGILIFGLIRLRETKDAGLSILQADGPAR